MEVYSYKRGSGFDRHTFQLYSRATDYFGIFGILCEKGEVTKILP